MNFFIIQLISLYNSRGNKNSVFNFFIAALCSCGESWHDMYYQFARVSCQFVAPVHVQFFYITINYNSLCSVIFIECGFFCIVLALKREKPFKYPRKSTSTFKEYKSAKPFIIQKSAIPFITSPFPDPPPQ